MIKNSDPYCAKLFLEFYLNAYKRLSLFYDDDYEFIENKIEDLGSAIYDLTEKKVRVVHSKTINSKSKTIN